MVPRAPSRPPADEDPPTPQQPRDASTASKASLPSYSPSNEADDERSPSDTTSMGPDTVRGEAPQYEDEDTRTTSSKELSGFYMYGWAAEVRMLIYNKSSATYINLLTTGLCRLWNGYAILRCPAASPWLMSSRFLHPNNPRTACARTRISGIRPDEKMYAGPGDARCAIQGHGIRYIS